MENTAKYFEKPEQNAILRSLCVLDKVLTELDGELSPCSFRILPPGQLFLAFKDLPDGEFLAYVGFRKSGSYQGADNAVAIAGEITSGGSEHDFRDGPLILGISPCVSVYPLVSMEPLTMAARKEILG